MSSSSSSSSGSGTIANLLKKLNELRQEYESYITIHWNEYYIKALNNIVTRFNAFFNGKDTPLKLFNEDSDPKECIASTISNAKQKLQKLRDYRSQRYYATKEDGLNIKRAQILDECYEDKEGQEFSCLSAIENQFYAKEVLAAKLREWQASSKKKSKRKLQYDCCFKKATILYTNSEGKKFRENSFEFKDFHEPERLPDGFTPIKPGDILYYPCAFGKLGKFIGAEHASIYIGGGASVHLYNDGKARLICTSVYKSASYQCEMLILDPDKNERFYSRIEIIERAVTAFCAQNSKKLQGQYAAMTNNCHQWVFDIAKRDALRRYQGVSQKLGCSMPIGSHKKRSIQLAKDRIEEEEKKALIYGR